MTIKSKDSDYFYSRLYRLAGKKEFPLKVLFELTYACNFNCIHCYNVCENKKELSTAGVKKILKQLQEKGTFHVGFTGGEPLLRKDIFEILDYAKRLGLRVTILTNGYLINAKIADKIASLGTNLNKVDISFLGADEKTFESITQKPGSFKKIKKSIQLLRKRNLDLMLKFTLMKQNKKQLKKISQLAKEWDCMFKYSPSLNAKTDGRKGPLQYRLSPEEVTEVIEDFKGKEKTKEISRKKDLKIRPGKNKFFRCGAGKTEASINPYGELKLCPEINRPVYNILKLGLDKAWAKLKKYGEKLENSDYVCKKCRLAGFCNSCPARMLIEEGSLNKCNQYDRQMAMLRAEEMGIT